MAFLIFVCLAAFIALLFILRRDRVSLGLPIAYLYSLLLIHVPGAFAHIAGRDFLLNSDLVELRSALSRVCGWPVDQPQGCHSVRTWIALIFGGFA